MEDLKSKILLEFEKQEKSALKSYSHLNEWSAFTIPLLFQFAKTGKLIRGTILLESYSLFSGQKNYPLSLACAVELVHSGLLIHDDIMDQDFLRRGEKTIPAVVRDEVSDLHIANSIAICAGDIAFFLAQDLSSQYGAEVNKFLSSEIIKVGLGQMQDVYPKGKISKESIISTYRFKTGRYTFSLPLCLGALLAGVNKETIQKLDEIGEIMGIMYQIEDDYLGIFGKDIGKEIGSDIRENKHTLYKFFLEKKGTQNSKKALSCFGKKISNNELIFIQQTLINESIVKEVDKIKNEYHTSAKEKILKLSLSHSQKECLLALLEIRIGRSK